MDLADVCLDMCAESVSDMSVAINPAIGASGTLQFLPSYSVDDYIRRWLSRLGTCRFAILPAGSTLMMMVGRLEHETALTVLRRHRKHWGGRRTVEDHT